MSLTKKRKQLIAASLAAMTAFGATVPAIVASAPAAFAAVDQGALNSAISTNLAAADLTATFASNVFSASGDSNSFIVDEGTDYATGSHSADEINTTNILEAGLATALNEIATAVAGSLDANKNLTLTVQVQGGASGTVALTENTGSGTAKAASAINTDLVTALNNALGGGTKTLGDLNGKTLTLSIASEEDTPVTSDTVTVRFRTAAEKAEEEMQAALDAAATTNLTTDNIDALFTSGLFGAGTGTGADGTGNAYVLAEGTAAHDTEITGSVRADSGSFAETLYNWANTNATTYNGKTVALVIDDNAASDPQTINLTTTSGTVADEITNAQDLATDIEEKLAALYSATDFSSLSEKVVTFKLQITEDSYSTAPLYVKFPTLEEVVQAATTYTITDAGSSPVQPDGGSGTTYTVDSTAQVVYTIAAGNSETNFDVTVAGTDDGSVEQTTEYTLTGTPGGDYTLTFLENAEGALKLTVGSDDTADVELTFNVAPAG